MCCITSRGSVGCAKKTTTAAVVLGSGLVAEATTTWDACCTFELTEWATCIHLYPVCVYTLRYKWIQMDTCIQSRAVFYWWTQVDTDTFCIRYKWIQVDTCSTRWIQVDTTCIQLYPLRCKRALMSTDTGCHSNRTLVWLIGAMVSCIVGPIVWRFGLVVTRWPRST